MIRFIYACLLRMRPAHFRRRFGEEMLWIFDDAVAERRTASLFADAIPSLWRQWTLRSVFWHQPDTANRAVPMACLSFMSARAIRRALVL